MYVYLLSAFSAWVRDEPGAGERGKRLAWDVPEQ